MDTKAILEKLEGHFNEVSTELKQKVAAQEAELKEFGVTKQATAERLAELTEQLSEISQEFKDAQTRLDGMEAESKRLDIATTEEMADLGQQFVDSAAYKNMIEANGRSSNRYSVKSFFPPSEKALLSTSGNAGDLVVEQRRPGIVIHPDRNLRLRDLMTVQRTTSNAIEFVRETGYANVKSTIASANVSGTDTSVTVANSEGFIAGQVIQVQGASTVNVTIQSINFGTHVLTLTGQLGTTTAVADKVTGRSTTSFDPGQLGATPESNTKPEMDVTYTLVTESVKTVAHWIPASRQILADASMLRGRINDRLMYGLKFAEEYHFLYGDGSSRELQGILTDADRQTYSWSAGTIGDTKVDAIRRALTLAQLAYYPVNGVVLNPTDWEDIELLKATDDHYIWVTVPDGGVMRVWSIPVVVTNAIDAGEFALGAWNLGTVVYDREEASIRVAEQHGTYFIENMVAVLAEERLVQTIERPEAFVHGTFDSEPS
jgi:hypothetical protein